MHRLQTPFPKILHILLRNISCFIMYVNLNTIIFVVFSYSRSKFSKIKVKIVFSTFGCHKNSLIIQSSPKLVKNCILMFIAKSLIILDQKNYQTVITENFWPWGGQINFTRNQINETIFCIDHAYVAVVVVVWYAHHYK